MKDYVEEAIHDRIELQEQLEMDEMFEEILMKWYMKGEI